VEGGIAVFTGGQGDGGSMKVEIPEQYVKYFEMLVEAGVYKEVETALTKCFKRGLEANESDIGIVGESGRHEPDMDMTLLQGKFVTIEVPSDPEFEKRLEFVSEKFAVPISEGGSIVLMLGLFHHYWELKHSQVYETNSDFRDKVRAMPHEPDEDMDESELSGEEGEDDG